MTSALIDIPGIRFYVCTGAIDTASQTLAPPLTLLKSERRGIFGNDKEFSDPVLQGEAGQLAREHGVAGKSGARITSGARPRTLGGWPRNATRSSMASAIEARQPRGPCATRLN